MSTNAIDAPRTHHTPYVCIGLRVVAITAFALSVIVLSAHLAAHLKHTNAIANFTRLDVTGVLLVTALAVLTTTFCCSRKDNSEQSEIKTYKTPKKYVSLLYFIKNKEEVIKLAQDTTTQAAKQMTANLINEQRVDCSDNNLPERLKQCFTQAQQLSPDSWRQEEDFILVHYQNKAEIFLAPQHLSSLRTLILAGYPNITSNPKIAEID